MDHIRDKIMDIIGWTDGSEPRPAVGTGGMYSNVPGDSRELRGHSGPHSQHGRGDH